MVDSLNILDWQPSELAAFEIAPTLSTADWVARHIRLAEKDSAIGGHVDPSLSWYLFAPGGPFDALDDPGIETVTVIAGTQVGKSSYLDWGMCALGAQRAGPQLRILPTEPDAREVAGKSLRDIVLGCEPLMARTSPTRLTREGYEFDDAHWYFGWSNSPASLSRRAIRYVWFDEVEKYPRFTGRESDPLELGDARLRTFRETAGAKSVRVTSPTTEDGLGWQSFLASDQRRFWTPCNECGGWQVLVWAQVRWPHGDDGHSVDGEQIKTKNLARYCCRHCGALWTDAQKNGSVRRGLWARAGETVEAGGHLAGTATKDGSSHAGYHLNAIYSSFTTLSWLAWKWLAAQGDIAKLQGFTNQELGEVWLEVESQVEESALHKHREVYIQGQAPAGVQFVTAFVDVQKEHFYVESRGWGYGMESWLLDWRAIHSETQLRDFLRGHRFERVDSEGVPLPPSAQGVVPPPLAIGLTLIDSGDQTAYVYQLVHDWAELNIRPTKGSDAMSGGLKLQATPITKNPRSKRAYKHALLLFRFENGYWKDTQARLAKVEVPGPGYFHLPADLPEEWFRQFTAEHKVYVHARNKARKWRRSDARGRVWLPKSEHRANHAWDCAVGNCLATDEQLANLRNLPEPGAPRQAPARRRIGRMR